MITLTYKEGIEINQVTRHQITLRGKGDGAFAFAVNKEVSLLPPLDNLSPFEPASDTNDEDLDDLPF